jgi:hypothetical protein
MATSPSGRTSCTPARVAANSSSVTLAASNGRRNAIAISNDGSTILYVKFGATATVTDYTVQIPATTGYWSSQGDPAYQGRIDGIWAGSPTGGAQISEW